MTFVRNDTDVYILNITLLNNKQPINLTNKTVSITFKKPDNNTVTAAVNILEAEKGKVEYKLGTSEISVEGTVTAEIQIFGTNEERLTSTQFQFYVRDELDDGGGIESSTEYPILTTLISDVAHLFQRIEALENSSSQPPQVLPSTISQGDPFTSSYDLIISQGDPFTTNYNLTINQGGE
jgi:hypothetical protein